MSVNGRIGRFSIEITNNLNSIYRIYISIYYTLSALLLLVVPNLLLLSLFLCFELPLLLLLLPPPAIFTAIALFLLSHRINLWQLTDYLLVFVLAPGFIPRNLSDKYHIY